MLISANGDMEKAEKLEPQSLNKIDHLKENGHTSEGIKEKNTNLNRNKTKEYKKCCNNELKKHISVVFIILFLLIFVASVALFCAITFTNKFNERIVENLILRNGSQTLEWWTKPPIEPLIKVHIFNYSNIDRYLKGIDDKIKVTDIGPYVYREIAEKVHLTFTEDDKITFYDNRTQMFDQKLSGKRREDDILIVPNVPLIAAISNVAEESFFSLKKAGLNTLIAVTNPKEFHSLSVKDYMYGYSDAFMNGIQTVKKDFNSERVGMLAGRKGISIDNFTVFTGEDSLENLGRIYAMNGLTEVNNWSTDECNQITGTDGSQFQPHMVDKEQILQIFIKSFCRTFPLAYEKEVTVLNGIPAWRYRSPKGVFDSSDVNPENACYCDNSIEKCPPNGVFDISSCADEIPLFISYPHFLEGDASLFERFEGLSPDPDLHATFADIHPRMAFPIAGSSRFQINMKVSSMGTYYNSLPKDVILPLCWIEITSGHIPEHLMSIIYHSTFSANASYITFQYGSLIGAMVSMILLLSTTYIYFTKLNTKSSETIDNKNIIVTLSVVPKVSQKV